MSTHVARGLGLQAPSVSATQVTSDPCRQQLQEAPTSSRGCTTIYVVPDGDLILNVNESDFDLGYPIDHLEHATGQSCHNGKVHLQIDSRHLCRVSKAFRIFLTPDGKAGTSLATTGSAELDLDDDEPTALALIMHFIFGKGKNVPERIGVYMMAQVCKLVDLYGLHDAMQPILRSWYKELYVSNPGNAHTPTMADLQAIRTAGWTPGDICAMMISITHVLGYKEAMERILPLALSITVLNFSDLELPMPQNRIDSMITRRQTCFQPLKRHLVRIKALYQARSRVEEVHRDCCDILVGTLDRYLSRSSALFCDTENMVLQPDRSIRSAVQELLHWDLTIRCRRPVSGCTLHGERVDREIKMMIRAIDPAPPTRGTKRPASGASLQRRRAPPI